MTKILSTYLPEDRIHSIMSRSPLPERSTGSVLIADISGFTLLTEDLRDVHGSRRGAEELTKYLNAVYTSLIALVEKNGGVVVDFAGDAIICWFSQNQANENAGLQAVACAWDMQAGMEEFATFTLSTGVTINLDLKISVASGPVRRFAVGDPEIRLMDVLAGETVTRMSRGESLANQGELLLDEATAQALGISLTISEWRTESESQERFAVVSEWNGKAPTQQPETAPNPAPEMIRTWLHKPVYDRTTSGQGAFLAEFRPCAALFIRFTGIDYDADSAGPKLDEFLHQIQAVILEHDGTLLSVTMGDKGSYACIGFGALAAHEDDARRAIKAALEIREVARHSRFIQPVRIGMSMGVQYVGTYGGPTRSTFSILGDDVNLAARLMQVAAPGEILLSERMQAAVSRDALLEPRPLIQVKGKAEPIPTFSLIGLEKRRAIRLQEPTYALPMVGRQNELARIAKLLDRAQHNEAQVISIVAEAGMGKSRLVAEVIRTARKKGFVGYGGACQSDGTNTPYLVWKPIWNALFDVDPARTPTDIETDLVKQVERLAPNRAQSLPLLGALLGLSLPENDFTSGLEPKTRNSALHSLLEDCLKSTARETPLLIVLEDLHWVDALSYNLLSELMRAITSLPICFVLAYRPQQLMPSIAKRLETLPRFTRIELTELTPSECETAIRAKLKQLYPSRGNSIPATLAGKLMARSQGNPFYLEELINYIHDHNLDLDQPAALDKIELPDSLHTLIISRIDQLTEREKTVLRVASIIGRLFRATWLAGYYPDLGKPSQLKADLDELDKLDITPLDTPEPELAYLFKHIVTHEVTYESLSFATRAQLHEQLARYLELTYASEIPLDTLAYHYGKSDNRTKMAEYFQKAGNAAQAAFANDAALDYFARLLPLLSTAKDKIDLLLKWGGLLEIVGKWEQAETNYRDALALAQTLDANQELLSRCQFFFGKLYRLRGDYPAALEWLGQAREGWKKLNSTQQLIRTLTDMGAVYWSQGEYETAKKYLEESLSMARKLNDKFGIAAALQNLGSVFWGKSDYPQARAIYNETLALHRELNNKQGISAALNNLGLVALDEGDYETAREFCEESLTLKRVMGDKRGIATTLSNIGIIVYEQGDYAAAKAIHEEGLALKREMGNKPGVAMSLNNLGNVEYDLGNYAKARSLYNESRDLCLEMGEKRVLAYALLGLGLVALAEKDSPKAHESMIESLKLRVDLEDKLSIISSLTGLAGVAVSENQPRRAAQLLGSVEALLQSIQARMESEVQRVHENTTKSAREALGEKDFMAAFAEGQTFALEQAVELALVN